MLSLGRKVGEKIIINNNIVITVIGIGRGRVRIGIEAPKDVKIWRGEIQEAINQAQRKIEKRDT